jgi:predicted metal-binding membrane protein
MSFAPQSFWPVATAVTMAIIWQCTPLKQRCLNRCHLHREIRAFGSAADLDTIRFGVTHGFWCVGSCWAMMLAPMLLSHGHVVAMAMVSVLMFGEWLEHPHHHHGDGGASAGLSARPWRRRASG